MEELDARRPLLPEDLDLGLPPVGDGLGQAELLDARGLLPTISGSFVGAAEVVPDRPLRHAQDSRRLALRLPSLLQNLDRHDLLPCELCQGSASERALDVQDQLESPRHACRWMSSATAALNACQARNDSGSLRPIFAGLVTCAIGQELIRAGRRVIFTTCGLMVQDLLAAKRDLKLRGFLKKISRYQVMILDDIGYVQYSREEMEVLFALLAERYERGSVVLTSNLPFSGWESIFKDPMTTPAAIDRLVHHSVIIELNVPSYRVEQAKKRRSNPEATDARKEA